MFGATHQKQARARDTARRCRRAAAATAAGRQAPPCCGERAACDEDPTQAATSRWCPPPTQPPQPPPPRHRTQPTAPTPRAAAAAARGLLPARRRRTAHSRCSRRRCTYSARCTLGTTTRGSRLSCLSRTQAHGDRHAKTPQARGGAAPKRQGHGVRGHRTAPRRAAPPSPPHPRRLPHYTIHKQAATAICARRTCGERAQRQVLACRAQAPRALHR